MSCLSLRRAGLVLSRAVGVVLLLAAAGGALAQAPPQAQPAPAGQAEPPAVVERSGNQISISGFVAAATVEAVKAHLAAPGAKIDTLLVFSTGADIDPLMELGRMIRGRRLALHVKQVCIGPCAIFLPAAAERLVVPQGALLVYYPLLFVHKQVAAQATGTPDEKKFHDMFERQAGYFRELGVDPDRAYAIGEAALIVKAALAGTGRPDEPLIVPDVAYLRKCLGISTVEMPDYTIADSVTLAHVSPRIPIAFLIGGKIYYEGKEVAAFDPRCGAD